MYIPYLIYPSSTVSVLKIQYLLDLIKFCWHPGGILSSYQSDNWLRLMAESPVTLCRKSQGPSFPREDELGFFADLQLLYNGLRSKVPVCLGNKPWRSGQKPWNMFVKHNEIMTPKKYHEKIMKNLYISLYSAVRSTHSILLPVLSPSSVLTVW